MKYETVIWDFNGTIVDDVELGIRAVNTMLAKRALPLLTSKEEYRAKLTFPIRDYYQTIGFDFTKESYDILANEWVTLYKEGEKEIRPCTGVREALSKIQENGIRQIILSASEISMLKESLLRMNLYHYFEEIIGQNNIYAHGKTESTKEYAKKLTGKSVLIGDTLHDFEMSRLLSADCILYSGGHASKSDLLLLGVPVVDDLREAAERILS